MKILFLIFPILLNAFKFYDDDLFVGKDKEPSYQCVMRDICGEDGDLKQNCPYNGPPIPFPINYEEKFKDLCPQLFTSVLGKFCLFTYKIKNLNKILFFNISNFLKIKELGR